MDMLKVTTQTHHWEKQENITASLKWGRVFYMKKRNTGKNTSEQLTTSYSTTEFSKFINQYLNEVRNQITWKKARIPATLELKEYIEDRYFALSGAENSSKLVEEQIVDELGDPQKVGNQLNSLHQPHYDIPLILCFLVLYAMGWLLNIICGTARFEVIPLLTKCVGPVLVFLLLHFDITFLVRKEKSVLCLASFLLVAIFLFDIRYGIRLFQFNYSYYVTIIYAGLLTFYIHIKNTFKGKYLLLFIYSLLFIEMCLMGSIPGILIIILIYCMNTVSVYNPSFSRKEKKYILAQIAINAVVFVTFFDWGSIYKKATDSSLLKYISTIFRNLTLWGAPEITNIDTADFLLMIFGQKYGLIPIFLLLCIYIALIMGLISIAKTQSLSVYRNFIGYLSIVFIINVFGAFINLTGLVYLGGMDLPFIGNGVCNEIVFFTLLGSALSIKKHETIIVDLLRQEGETNV